MFEIDRSSSSPLYMKIADTLKNHILSGTFATGSQLPGEHQLAARFNTSRVTLRKGLKILEEQNLILQRHGLGAFVTYNAVPKRYKIGILELPARGNYNLQVLSALMHALQLKSNCEFAIIPNCDSGDKLLDELNNQRCDGLLAIAPRKALALELCRSAFDNIPAAVIGMAIPELAAAGRAAADIEPDAIGRAVDYLVKLGHRRIAYLSAQSDDHNLELRNRSFREAARRHRLVPERDYILDDYADVWFDGARNRARELMNSDHAPSAILTPGNLFSLGAWQGVMEAGKSVPGDVSLLGFDCDESLNPHYSSVMQPIDKLAQMAADALFDALRAGRNNHFSSCFLPVELIERGSCGRLTQDC